MNYNKIVENIDSIEYETFENIKKNQLKIYDEYNTKKENWKFIAIYYNLYYENKKQKKILITFHDFKYLSKHYDYNKSKRSNIIHEIKKVEHELNKLKSIYKEKETFEGKLSDLFEELGKY